MILHIIFIYLTSLLATVFLFPVSSLDAYIVGSFAAKSFWITIPVAILFEVFNAWLTYKMANKLIPLVVRREKSINKFKEMGNKLDKHGWWIILVAAMTPLPYSITIYAAGAVDWGDNKRFLSAIAIGRTVKYVLLAVALFYGWQIAGFL